MIPASSCSDLINNWKKLLPRDGCLHKYSDLLTFPDPCIGQLLELLCQYNYIEDFKFAVSKPLVKLSLKLDFQKKNEVAKRFKRELLNHLLIDTYQDNYFELSKVLLDLGADTEEVLILVISDCFVAAKLTIKWLNLLYQYNAKIDTAPVRYHDGTYLHLAAYKRNPEAVWWLLWQGLDHRATNEEGDTPLAISRENSSVSVLLTVLPNLQTIICLGLCEKIENSWTRFLLQGVYDPRIFLSIILFCRVH